MSVSEDSLCYAEWFQWFVKVSSKLDKMLGTERAPGAYGKAQFALSEVKNGWFSFYHTEQCPDIPSVCYKPEIRVYLIEQIVFVHSKLMVKIWKFILLVCSCVVCRGEYVRTICQGNIYRI